ncbi:uncharacterized protein MYCFIDRAFT_170267 [Pseudocercospora fijiensis CIRAD86]|uniref:EKC/KEOPS complex subunit BUD32 n=1 Tax=Pseudocercospora fijiensis (strain CIRAD86) TaxID=383855 RepID=N1QA82_PSEFD|nr:uncharacterized protein MYCFIDRAFT_170267 [Pseudocercospora fijiensis CIRAD86]EME88681.1 hypothetical protein MYCFIDRAFT_170267 [Pseudocercospora fijiensis CIRAD86]
MHVIPIYTLFKHHALNGLVAKSPWPGEQAERSQADLQREARAHRQIQEGLTENDYTRRFIRLISCDPSDSTLTMEYAKMGTLRNYLQAHAEQIDQSRRYSWILAMAEGLAMLHAQSIIHCDFTPNNMLLDDRLELKITDFGCCSIDGSRPTGAASIRFDPCNGDWRTLATQVEDLFALGSSIFEVLTGKRPLEDIPSESQIRFRRSHWTRDGAFSSGGLPTDSYGGVTLPEWKNA